MSNQWIISKSHAKNSQDSADEQILFTNENLALPGTSQSINTYPAAAFDGNGILYGPGMYSGAGNQNVNNTPVENYNPDFIIDRKIAGLGLPDYSPTKSINEYLVGTKAGFMDPNKQLQSNPINFANNSDPYVQSVKSQDGSSPYSDDSSVLTGVDGYKIKDEVILHSKSNAGFVGSDEYIEMMNRKRQRLMILGEDHRGHVGTNDQILIYDGNTTIQNTAPPPPYVSLLKFLVIILKCGCE